MASINRVLYNILLRRNDFCSLCFESTGEGSIHVTDEVVLNLNCTENKLEMSEILSYVLGEDFNLQFDTVCNQCTRSIIDSYTFIKMCKENSQHLCRTLESLTNALEYTTDELYDCRSLYVSLDSRNFTSKQYYDNKRPVATRTAAFKRFQSLANKKRSRPKIEIEILPKVNNQKPVGIKIVKKEGSPDKSPVKHVRKKMTMHKYPNDFETITISDMILDKNDLTNIKCKVCRRDFNTLAYLRQHYIRVHAPKCFKCPKCPRSYGSLSLLENHKYDSHCTVVCSECGKTFHNRHTLKMHEMGHHLRLVCQACGRVYKNKNTFKTHIELGICGQTTRKSPAEAQYTCDICKKRYSHKHTLGVHIKFEHGNGKVHTCKWCDKKFSCQSRLNAHIVTHTQEKNFNCELCGGKFVTKESLLYHTRIHTGEKPYQCQLCDRTFLSSSRRAEHVRRHHKGPSLECDICHSKFKARASLLKHKKKHFDPNSRLHYSKQMSDNEDFTLIVSEEEV